jgi:hypothetical protein
MGCPSAETLIATTVQPNPTAVGFGSAAGKNRLLKVKYSGYQPIQGIGSGSYSHPGGKTQKKHWSVGFMKNLKWLTMVLMLIGVGAFGQMVLTDVRAEQNEDATYVGSEVCKECHEDQFETFSKFAKKAHSYNSVKVMEKGLTDTEKKTCYACHTTGYGKPGGFISAKQTPHLKDAGCEVCHGPGSAHVDSEDPDDIITELVVEDCQVCHNSERVAAFNFKPLLFGGAH